MNLKKATKLVYLSLIAQMILSGVQWAIYSFNLYGVFGQWFSTLTGLLHLVLAIPMILFFGALNTKQNAQPGSNPPDSTN
jgi:uncharacterized membrane protein